MSPSEYNSFNAVGDNMYFINSNGNILRNNSFWNNGIWFNGAPETLLQNDIDQSNTVNGKKIACYSNAHGLDQENFTNSGMVILLNCSDSKISNLNIERTHMGISLIGGENITVENNSVQECYYYGIFLNEAMETVISNNEITNNKNGIKIDYAYNTILEENDILENQEMGIELWGTNDNEIRDNSIANNKHGMYFIASKRNIVTKNDFTENSHSGIYFTSCSCGTNTNNVIVENLFSENGDGINIRYSHSTEVSENTIVNNLKNGIVLHSSDFSKISHNFISTNAEFGILLKYSNHNEITDNVFDDNGQGCYSEFSCKDNIFENNDCISGTSQPIVRLIIVFVSLAALTAIMGIYYKLKHRKTKFK